MQALTLDISVDEVEGEKAVQDLELTTKERPEKAWSNYAVHKIQIRYNFNINFKYCFIDILNTWKRNTTKSKMKSNNILLNNILKNFRKKLLFLIILKIT